MRTLFVTTIIQRNYRNTLNLLFRPFGFLRFTPKRFHVLLNSLFKVLFNFPSRYLFAIGLVVIFSLRWSLPPTQGCTLKQPDSEERSTCYQQQSLRAWHPLWAVAPFKMDLDALHNIKITDPPKHHISQCPVTATGFSAGLIPIRSPLLRESQLVSFPPLNNMLKFSGQSHLL